MATADSGSEDRFAKVSSLYGPGTIAAWYFTILSVLVSWILHPSKRKSGSIDVDLIATLSLPAVAAGHVMSQAHLFLYHKVYDDNGNGRGLIQLIAATEAPFIVTETFMALSVILFLVAAWMLCIRRAIIVALIGLQCFVVECYVHFSSDAGSGFRYRTGTLAKNYPAFSRLFVADFIGLVVTIIVVLGLLAVITGLVVISMLLNSKKESSSSGQDIERSSHPQANLRVRENLRSSTAVAQTRSHVGATTVVGRSVLMAQVRQLDLRSRFQRLEMTHDRHLLFITHASTIFLPLSFVASLGPIFWHSTWDYSKTSTEASLWNRVTEFAIRFVRDFFPRTACSITDLDQAVAAVTGATALAFSIYSVAKAYYKIWIATGNGADTELARRTPANFELSPLEDRPRRRSL